MTGSVRMEQVTEAVKAEQRKNRKTEETEATCSQMASRQFDCQSGELPAFTPATESSGAGRRQEMNNALRIRWDVEIRLRICIRTAIYL